MGKSVSIYKSVGLQ